MLIAMDGVLVVVWALIALVVWALVSVNGMVVEGGCFCWLSSIVSLVVIGSHGSCCCGRLLLYVGVGIWPWSSFVVHAWFIVCLLFEGDRAHACHVKNDEGRCVG